MSVQIVLGTLNPSKLEEMQSYFAGTEVQSVSPGELTKDHPLIPETASTVRGNAILKAKAWNRITGLPVIAEDSGLIFLDLPVDHPDQPGQFVRRLDGRSMSDEEMLSHYIELVHRHGGKLRACWSNCWCILEDEDHGELHENASVPFYLLENPSPNRHNGWPLDSISWLPEVGKYLVDCTEEDMEYRNRKGGYTDTFHLWILEAADHLISGTLPRFE